MPIKLLSLLLLLLYPLQVHSMNIGELASKMNIKTVKTGDTGYGVKCDVDKGGFYFKGTKAVGRKFDSMIEH